MPCGAGDEEGQWAVWCLEEKETEYCRTFQLTINALIMTRATTLMVVLGITLFSVHANAAWNVEMKLDGSDGNNAGYTGQEYHCYDANPFALTKGSRTFVSGTYSNQGYFEGYATTVTNETATLSISWYGFFNTDKRKDWEKNPIIDSGVAEITLSKDANGKVFTSGKYDPAGSLSTCRGGKEKCFTQDWKAATQGSQYVNNMTDAAVEQFCWKGSSGKSSNIGSFTRIGETGTIDGCDQPRFDGRKTYNWNYENSFTYVYSQKECDEEGYTCPYTQFGYEHANLLPLQTGGRTSDLAVGVARGIDKDFRKMNMYAILRKSFVDSTGRPALAEFNCYIDETKGGKWGGCYHTIYRAAGSNVATRSSCRRFLSHMDQTKSADAKSGDADLLTKLHWYSRTLVGLAIATLIFAICGWAKIGAIFKVVIADRDYVSRKSVANPVVMMTKQHKPIMP